MAVFFAITISLILAGIAGFLMNKLSGWIASKFTIAGVAYTILVIVTIFAAYSVGYMIGLLILPALLKLFTRGWA